MNSTETNVAPAEKPTVYFCPADPCGPFLRIPLKDLSKAETLVDAIIKDLWVFDPYYEPVARETWVTFATISTPRAFEALVFELKLLAAQHGFEFRSWE